MDEPPTVSPSHQQPDETAIRTAANGLGRQGRPRQVAVAGWVIVASSGLMLLAVAASAPTMFRIQHGWLWWVAGLAYASGRLALGFGVLRGRVGARWLYLLGDALALNLSVAFLRTTGAVTNAQVLGSVTAVLCYLAALILLTRRAALSYFGRPLAPQMSAARSVAVLFAFCVVYAVIGGIMFRAGWPAMSVASDRYNLVSLFSNALGQASGSALLQSSSFQALNAKRMEIDMVRSHADMSRALSGPVYAAARAVNRNSSWIGMLWLVNYVAIFLLVRRR